jgi:hypothetical protein
LPHDLEVDTKVLVNGNISEADNIFPFNFRILFFYCAGNSSAGFPLSGCFIDQDLIFFDIGLNV